MGNFRDIFYKLKHCQTSRPLWGRATRNSGFFLRLYTLPTLPPGGQPVIQTFSPGWVAVGFYRYPRLVS